MCRNAYLITKTYICTLKKALKMKAGIVGLPNVGKSTLFNCLSNAKAQSANFPFCTIEPNIGVVNVPDPRLSKLEELVNPERVIPATVEIVDIAGLVKGASKGEGLGNQFLGNIRECNAIIHVLRCFDNDNIVHVDGNTNKLNKDIKPTPVMVRKSTSVSGDYIPPQQLGQTVRYQMNGEDYIFITDKSGYQVQAANNKNYAKLRRTSNDNYIYRTNDKVSISYFDNEGNLVVETYDDSNDAVTKEVYTRVQQ